MHTNRIFFLSAAGGVGTSSVAAGLACRLAANGLNTLLTDLSPAAPSLDLLLGCEDRVVFDLGDLLASRQTPGEVALRFGDNLSFIPGAFHLPRLPEAGEISKVLDTLCASLAPAFLLVDLPCAARHAALSCLAKRDLAILVTTAAPLALRGTASLALALAGSGAPRTRLLVNHAPPLCDLREVVDTTRTPLIGVVPHDPALSVPAAFTASPAHAAFAAVAARLVGEHAPLCFGRDNR